MPSSAGAPPAPKALQNGQLYLHVAPTLQFYDGRTANRPWAQEIPDTVAKAVWGSWAEVHPDTAKQLKITHAQLLTLKTDHGSIQVPALITDRVQPDTIAVPMGQGHTNYGRYATGTGVNPLALLPATLDASGALMWSGVPVSVQPVAVRRAITILQTSMKQAGSDIARGLTLAKLALLRKGREEPVSEEKRHSLYANHPTGEHHWGMAIDLDRCVGCNACAAACYAENNVPVVGKDECSRGREMAWLWLEKYDDAGPEEKGLIQIQTPKKGVGPTGPRPMQTRFIPMLCQHCDNAPCEYVCPVYATFHDAQHLNEQVYNRCVGTRYCSNNCPYKVRRFNWFQNQFAAPLDQQLNPDVSHRTKGVMEKCSFCIQRVRGANIRAKTQNRKVADGEVQTACMQACPADAIIFGDLNDPNSEVRRLSADARGYGVLEELNTYPNITYLARVRAE